MNEMNLGTVTVLFTDVVGSTESRRRLGDSRAERIRGVVDSTQIDVIEQHGGRVVKGTGDGIMAVFSSAVNALEAAAEIVARTRAAGQRGIEPIELRVGLSAGDVSQADEDVFGTPVVEAARLCAVATGDEILVADVVRVLAGSWSEYPLQERGDIDLRGLGTLRHWSLDWTGASIPDSDAVGILVDEEFSFVGRSDELEMLQEMWSGVIRGERAAAFLIGEPGVGKTRLIVELARRIIFEGGLVLSGRCEEGVTAPLLPFHGVVEMYLKKGNAADIRTHAGPFVGELSRHFPALAASVREPPGTPDSNSETERWRLLAGLTHLLRAAAARQSAAVIIDDVQWADPATRSLLDRILREPDLGSIGFFFTMRDAGEDVGFDVTSWLAQLERLPRVHSLQLSGLDTGDLRSLVDQSGLDVDVAEMWEQTGGHPFFVSELVRFARESDANAQGIPQSIHGLLSDRLGRLPTNTANLLTAGAVAGSEFDLAIAGELAGLSEDEAVRAAEAAVEARLVIDVPDRFDRYQFTHRLVADAITEQTSTSRRIRLHRDFATALEERGETSAEVARHVLAAAPLVGLSEAVAVTRRAAREAFDRGSPDQAASLLAGAVELGVDPAVRAELEFEIGNALNFDGRPAEGVPWFERAAAGAIEHDRFDLLAQAALASWAGSPWLANFDPRAPKLLKAALDHCPEDDVISRARLEAGLAAFSIFSAPLDERESVTAEAVAVARAHGNAATLAATLVSRHVAINCPMACDEVELVNAELASMTTDRGTGIPGLVGVPVNSMLYIFGGVSTSKFWRGDGDAFWTAANAFDLDNPRTPDFVATLGYQQKTSGAILGGQLEEARTASKRAADVGGWGDASLGNYMWQQLLIDWLAGDISASRPLATDLYERFGGQPMRCTLAWIEAASGNHASARELLDRVGIDRLPRLPELMLGTIGLATCALAVWHLGDSEWAEAVISAFEPVAELMSGVPWNPFPAGHFFCGLMHTLLGDTSAADDAFHKALLVHERLRAQTFIAVTKASHGRSLATVDPHRSHALLNEARELAAMLGLPTLLSAT